MLIRPFVLLPILLLTLGAQSVTLAAAEHSEVSMIEVEGEGARYWSRWRGPSGQGYVQGEGYVDTWGEDRNILWKVEHGCSSVSVKRKLVQRESLQLSQKELTQLPRHMAIFSLPLQISRKHPMTSSGRN